MSLLSNLHIRLFHNMFSLADPSYAIRFAFHSFIFSQQEDTEAKDPKLLNKSCFIKTHLIETLYHTQKTCAHETGRGK